MTTKVSLRRIDKSRNDVIYSSRGLATVDHSRQRQQLCAYAQFALRGNFQVHDEAHSVLLHHKLNCASGFGKAINVADRQDTGFLKAGQDGRSALAFGGTDEKNMTTAQVVTIAVLNDFDAAALSLLSGNDTYETFTKGIVSNDANHNRRMRIDKSVFRPFHEFREVE